MPPLTGEVEIERSTSAIRSGEVTLHNVSLNVPAGTFVGLVDARIGEIHPVETAPLLRP